MPPAKPPRSSARRRATSAACSANTGRQPGNARPAQPPEPAVTIEDVIAGLVAQLRLIATLIAAADPDDIQTLIRLCSLQSLTASRLGRLLRDQRAISGKAADGIAGAIAQALDELSNELGQEL